MKQVERVYNEMLCQAIEKNNRRFTQSDLSKRLNISLSTVNHSLAPLRKMGAVTINRRNLILIDPKKLLYYWASVRNLKKDIIYSTRADLPVREIESSMPDSIIYTAYSAYKFRFNDVPADYSEVYVYSDDSLEERFPKNNRNPNLFVLRNTSLKPYGKITSIANTFVDLWNIDMWYTKDFLNALEARLNGLLE